MKNKWFSLPVWLDAIKIEIENTTDEGNSNDLINTLLSVSNLKQSLKEIVHYENKNNNCANPYGLYVHEDRPRLMIDGKSVRQSRFAVLSSKEKSKLPPKSNLNASNSIIDALPSTIRRNLLNSTKKSPKRSTASSIESSSPAAKRTKPNSIINTTDASEEVSDNHDEETSTTNDTTDDNTYWNSPEARRLFGYMNPVTYEEEEQAVEEIIVKRLEAFHKAHLDAEGYKVLVEDNNFKNNLTTHQIFLIRQKCKYLYHSLCIALEQKSVDGEKKTWLECCAQAIKKINEFESIPSAAFNKSTSSASSTHTSFSAITNARTIARWFHAFRSNNESFMNIMSRQQQKNHHSPLLDANKDFKDELLQFAKTNISTLRIELIHNHVHEVMLPDLLQKRIEETGNNMLTLEEVLSEYGLKKLTIMTLYRWMRSLGFNYSVKTKTYYVDGHERPDVVEYRIEFIKRYKKCELQSHRWVQLSETEVDLLIKEGCEGEDKGFKKHQGYKYTNDSNITMFEFHVDDHSSFPDRVQHYPQFGGDLSVRRNKSKKPLIMFGQDECIFKQYLFGNKKWFLPDGTTSLLPKDEGMGIMISAFCSREFGYGFEFTPERMIVVNEFRMKEENKKYKDHDASVAVNGKNEKKALTSNPFVVEFDYGTNKEGYWGYNNMVLQMEDCIDVLRACFGDMYEYYFLFDHSSGHAKQRIDGLDATKMNQNFGGAQKRMRDTIIKDETYLGPYSPTLKVGDVQSMTFNSNDSGPCKMSPAEANNRRNDKALVGAVGKEREKTIAQLIKSIQVQTGVAIGKYGNKTDLQERARLLGLPTTYLHIPISEGWVDKPKGTTQVLYERGWLEPGEKYTAKEEVAILKNLPDFVNELTQLQYIGSLLDVFVDCSPKFHPEIAGEGIEYCWGLAKNTYRLYPIKDKKKKSVFEDSVRKCQCRNETLTTKRVRAFGKRVHNYMDAYLGLAAVQHQQGGDAVDAAQPEMSCSLIEKVVKKLLKPHKGHRCIMEQEHEFFEIT